MRLHINAFKEGISRVFSLPRLSLPLISTLGLTLAAVLTVVSLANTLLLRPLPDINENGLYRVNVGLQFSNDLTVPFFSEPRRVASAQQHFGDALSWGYVQPNTTDIEIHGEERQVARLFATSGSPETLGLTLLQGQGSTIANAEEGVWISKSLWQSKLGTLDDLSQQIVRMDGTDYPILGVFDNFISIESNGLNEQITEQIWQFRNLESTLESPDSITLNIEPMTFVRGSPNAIPTQNELESWFKNYVETEITEEQARAFIFSKPLTTSVLTYRDVFLGDSQQLLMVLIFTMLSLLIMASLNLLNMFIAHYQTRNKEFSIQICMGSSLSTLRSLIFVENLPMFLMATLLGLIGAGWLIKLLPVLAGSNLPLLDQIGLDVSSVLVALVLITFINMIFATIALAYVDKHALTDTLNSSGKGTPAQQKQGISKVLMIVQLTLACVLLTAASVSVKESYVSTYSDLGYSIPNAYEISMPVIDSEWQTELEGFEQYRGSEWQLLRYNFIERLSALGGKVIDTHALPLTNNLQMSAYRDPDTNESVMIRPLMWAPNMLSTFEIQLLAGRDLTTDDIESPHVLVSKAYAIQKVGEKNWQSIVEQEIKLGDDANDIYIVKGVVEDVHPLPTAALPVNAPGIYFSSPVRVNLFQLTAVVIMPSGQDLQEPEVSEVLNGMDPRLGELSISSMEQRWYATTEATRLNMYVVMGLAALTLVLAIIGVSGLSQMAANQKRYELAVRMATGAKQSRLLKLLMQDSFLMLGVGLSLGVVAAVFGYQYMVGLLDNAPAFDWSVTMAINTILGVVMLVSIAIPGWIVISKDPMRVLREL